jgi:serine phosphatase RsbU (regulator of sigma subunit)
MSRTILVGVFDNGPPRVEPLQSLFSSGSWCRCEQISLEATGRYEGPERFDAVVLADRPDASPAADASLISLQQQRLERLGKAQVGVLILTDRPWVFADFSVGVVCLASDSSQEVVRGALLVLARMRPAIRQVHEQFVVVKHLNKNLRERFVETNRELQLASRLQRDFLPKENSRAGPLQFTTMFRPCTWVSGDIFDIFRLDERHWGFYLADAVGHGVAAGLLAMYIKHAIRPKRIHEGGYELYPPSKVLGHLNDVLASHGLSDSQFITGWYGVINIETLVLDFAVAGHPPALHIDPEGGIRELHGEGCLLGLAPGMVFSDETITLGPGHRILVYSDGLEPTFIAQRPPMPRAPIFEAGIPELLRQPANDLVVRLRERLDTAPGSLAQEDDVSLLMMDVDGGELSSL